ncbi:TDP-N-acetylfucosamine:lipid II N-acetylfucosaminyltransferase [Salmonella enterica subsp. enterica serovar Choleraesuis]|nr:TDP-N-acetylfucosamine:lipid II N-acetylfucosaminyltransferase [Salmonella enterica subsp. enterica serovar Choleraesuis]
MTTLIHVLGSDIPHHNHTVLSYFDQHLAPSHSQAREFMVACREPDTLPDTPQLNVNCWPDKKSLAQAVIARAKSNRQLRFFFHGQFNATLWLALLCGGLKRNQACWHIWGADLYENSTSFKFQLFYRLRRIAQGRLARVFGTRGDLKVYQQRHAKVPVQLLYFPTRMAPVAAGEHARIERETESKLTILIGNSGDRSNEHIHALRQVAQQFSGQAQVVVPMGYPENNQAYIEEVERAASELFAPEDCQVLRERMAFDDYQKLINRCSLGYFLFERQQGIGTLCLLIQAGVPCVLSRRNPFWQDMVEQQLPVLFDDDVLDVPVVQEARRQLSLVDLSQVAFFNPNYQAGWLDAITTASGVSA